MNKYRGNNCVIHWIEICPLRLKDTGQWRIQTFSEGLGSALSNPPGTPSAAYFRQRKGGFLSSMLLPFCFHSKRTPWRVFEQLPLQLMVQQNSARTSLFLCYPATSTWSTCSPTHPSSHRWTTGLWTIHLLLSCARQSKQTVSVLWSLETSAMQCCG